MEPLRVGIVGCGNISGIYFENLSKYRSTEIVEVADLDMNRARDASAKWNVPKAVSTEELLASQDVELVLNLTVPKAHASVALAAVEAGKHVYNEKPLTIERSDARRLLDAASARGVRV
ncbi:MAG TPA: Gfo/Idh/MocA family oxidoreductase, partial [Fimbriimonas sp.]